jgi:hypothetical protein
MFPIGGFLPGQKEAAEAKAVFDKSREAEMATKISDIPTSPALCIRCERPAVGNSMFCADCHNLKQMKTPNPAPLHYSHARWEKLLSSTIEEINKLATLKGGEYAGDEDRLANFRRNGIALGLPIETIWAVYAGKHWDAIQQYIKDTREGTSRVKLEPISGRVDDLLVYLLLLKAMLDERGEL